MILATEKIPNAITTMPPHNVVEFSHVEKDFGRVKALRGLSFRMSRGEIFGLIGPNGSGKTTTIRLMLDFYRSYRGQILILGKNPLHSFSLIGPHLGVIFEDSGMNEHLTALEYLEYYGGIFDLSKETYKARSSKLLKLVGLADRGQSLIRTFSKGMKQRLAFARAMINQPQLLILDEPFDGIDAEARSDLATLIKNESKNSGVSVFLTSHNLQEVEEICDRVAIIKDGHILACDRMSDLGRGGDGKALYQINLPVGSSPDMIRRIIPEGHYDREKNQLVVALKEDEIDLVIKELLHGGVAIKGFSEQKMSLRDYYFSLTRGEEGEQGHE